jgi:hypothetical protein
MENNLRTNFKPSVKMHKVKVEVSLRDEFKHILFTDKYAYVTNGFVVVRNDLSEISNFSDKELQLLNNKSLSIPDFEKLLKYKHVEVLEEGILAKDGNVDILFKFSNTTFTTEIIEELINSTVETEDSLTNYIKLDSKYIIQLTESLYNYDTRFKFTFKGEHKPVLVTSEDCKSMALICRFV